jgi:hypothetical protein
MDTNELVGLFSDETHLMLLKKIQCSNATVESNGIELCLYFSPESSIHLGLLLIKDTLFAI